MIAFARDNEPFDQAQADVTETHNILLFFRGSYAAKFSTRDPDNITAWCPTKTGYTIKKLGVGH